MSYQTKHSSLTKLYAWLETLRKLNTVLKNSKGVYISKKEIQNIAKNTSVAWFDERLNLLDLGADEEILEKYDDEFKQLLQLSLSRSRIKSYRKTIDRIISLFVDELIVTIAQFPILTQHMHGLYDVLRDVDINKIKYLTKAVDSAHYSHHESSAMLGWSAAINVIHETINALGFDTFNEKCAGLKEARGRYKRFKKIYTITNFADLRQVCDGDLLWIIEYWGLIDNNQHDRLEICRTMRNNAAHSGEAEISPENLLSFFSDLKNIVFTNDNFQRS